MIETTQLPGISAAKRCDGFEYAIRNFVRAAEEVERAGRRVTYLNIGDPQCYGFRPPAHLVSAVSRALKDGFTGYAHSAGLMEAREAVADSATALGAPTRIEDVFMTAGASEAADLLLTALLNPGDEVLLPAVGYPLYPAILGKLDGRARYYQVRESDDWEPCAEQVASLVNDRTRAIVLINPSNPTGAITSDGVTRKVLEIAAERNLLVVSDEVYRELCFDEAPTPASVLAQEVPVPVVTLESMSKTYLVSGWRVGWMRFTHPERMADLIAAIGRLADGRLCAPTPAQYAVRPAVTGSKLFLERFVKALKSRRDLSMSKVRANPALTAFEPRAAFYMMIRVNSNRAKPDMPFVLNLLNATSFLVVHGSGFGADLGEGYFRLVYLPEEQILERFFEELGGFLCPAS